MQSNPHGLYISVTVVITFHPMFITMVDKAYNVQCFYMEADKQVTAELGVRSVLLHCLPLTTLCLPYCAYCVVRKA